MDESWRMRMGMGTRTTTNTTTLPRRRSTEEAAALPRHSNDDCDDFSDVFGGPPRSVLSRKFSADFTRPSDSFYQEIFRPPDFVVQPRKGPAGRSLPAFQIPARGRGFYSDVFGSAAAAVVEAEEEEVGWRSRERSRPNSKGKSKSNSSSVLSSEELSPLRQAIAGDDVALSSFTSKLRPLNVPCRWNTSMMRSEEKLLRKQGMPSFTCHRPSYTENIYMENEDNENSRGSYFKFPRQVSSPETISLEPNACRSVKIPVDDLVFNSPSSPVSSICQEPEPKAGVQSARTMEDGGEEEMEPEEDEVMSSYVIEINSDNREGTGEAVSIDEAIAWAKEKFQSQSFDSHRGISQSAESEERPSTFDFVEQQMNGDGSTQSLMEEELQKQKSEEETELLEKDMEMELLDEDVRLWSAGKETEIRLLLSTLHHILWPDSGWHPVPLTGLIESSQVKKAYQKARLCIHPDKLQQRGATLPQKYVAEKAFSLLQDAWAAFISQDVFFN